MKQTLALAMSLALCAFTISGCSKPQNEGNEVPKEAMAQVQDLVSVARKAGGDWDKLSPADQKRFVDYTSGNVDAAKSYVAGVGRHGGGPPRPAGN